MLVYGNFALGFISGGVAAVFLLIGVDFFDLPISGGAASTILGAVIGALIAFCGSVMNLADLRSQRDADLLAKNQAMTRAIVTKFIDLNDGN